MGQGGLRGSGCRACCDAAAARATRAAYDAKAPIPSTSLGGRPEPLFHLINCCEESTDVDQSALVEYQLLSASADGDLELIKASLKSGADIEARRPLVFRTGLRNNVEPENEDADFQEVLVLEGQGVFETRGFGFAHAVSSDTKEAKGPMDSARMKGLTPLMRAAKDGRSQAVSLLLEMKASPHATDEDGKTPLHYAASAGCRATCTILLKNGASRCALDDGQRDAFATVPREFLGSTKERAEWLALLRS